MLRTLGGIWRVLAVTWPALLAWYIAGSLVRAAVLAFAAPIGPENPLGALLLVPIAVLARLVSYIGMFLVLRKALVGYRTLASGDVEFHSVREGLSEFISVLLASVGPFFALYAAIGLLSQDLSEYARAAFRYAIGSDSRGFEVGASPLAFGVLVISLVLRYVLKVLAPRLPRWMELLEIYLEATWIFVALTAINALFGPLTEWIGNRQVVHWLGDSREFLSGVWAPIRLAFEGIDWATPVALQLVVLPLAWLLVACIVYLRALGNIVEDAKALPVRISATVARGASRMPPLIKKYEHLITETWDEVGQPLLFAARIVRRSGFSNLMIFLAAYGTLFALGQWSLRLIYTAMGPHDTAFWWIADAGISTLLMAIVEPIRIVLLAVTFDFCLQRWHEFRMRVPNNAATVTASIRT